MDLAVLSPNLPNFGNARLYSEDLKVIPSLLLFPVVAFGMNSAQLSSPIK